MSTHTHTRQGAVGRLMVLLIVKVLGYPENIRKEFCLTCPRPLLKAQSSHSNWSSHWKQMPYRQGSAALARRWKWDSPVAPPRDRAPSKIPRSSLPWTFSDIWLPNQHEALVSCGLIKPLGLLPLGKPLSWRQGAECSSSKPPTRWDISRCIPGRKRPHVVDAAASRNLPFSDPNSSRVHVSLKKTGFALDLAY